MGRTALSRSLDECLKNASPITTQDFAYLSLIAEVAKARAQSESHKVGGKRFAATQRLLRLTESFAVARNAFFFGKESNVGLELARDMAAWEPAVDWLSSYRSWSRLLLPLAFPLLLETSTDQRNRLTLMKPLLFSALRDRNFELTQVICQQIHELNLQLEPIDQLHLEMLDLHHISPDQAPYNQAKDRLQAILTSGYSIDAYNTACAFSLLGNHTEALQHLKQVCRQESFCYSKDQFRVRIESDPDFGPLSASAPEELDNVLNDICVDPTDYSKSFTYSAFVEGATPEMLAKLGPGLCVTSNHSDTDKLVEQSMDLILLTDRLTEDGKLPFSVECFLDQRELEGTSWLRRVFVLTRVENGFLDALQRLTRSDSHTESSIVLISRSTSTKQKPNSTSQTIIKALERRRSENRYFDPKTFAT